MLELTIGIPTYNGDKYLAEAIDSVLRQLPDLTGRQIEILVSDNASTDSTAAIVRQYCRTYPGIVSYTCNEQNVGYDLNVEKLFKEARGEYLWLLGDDDMLVPGALNSFFSVLDRHQDIALFLLSVSFQNITTGLEQWDRKFPADLLCGNGDELLQRSLWGSSSLSSLCVRRNYWNAENLDRYLGTQWIHIGALLQIMRHPRKAYVFSDKMVTVRISNPRWADNGQVLEIGLKHLAVFEIMKGLGYDSRTFDCFLASRYADNLRDICNLKPAGLSNKIAAARHMIHFFQSKPAFWLVHLPMLFVPKALSTVLFGVGRRVGRLLS